MLGGRRRMRKRMRGGRVKRKRNMRDEGGWMTDEGGERRERWEDGEVRRERMEEGGGRSEEREDGWWRRQVLRTTQQRCAPTSNTSNSASGSNRQHVP
jgi:hypothetical protein